MTGQLVEVDHDVRENQWGWSDWKSARSEWEYEPRCLAMKINFAEEMVLLKIGSEGVGKSDGQLYTGLLHKKWECDKFIPWCQGFTPKEHQEMLDRQRQIEFQTKREDEDRKWRAEQARLAQEWREQQAAEDKTWREDQENSARTRFRWEVAATLVVGVVVFTVVTLVAAFISRGRP